MFRAEWSAAGVLPAAAIKIREDVFVTEQGFTDEFDDHDKESWHLVIYDGDVPIATGRLFRVCKNIYKPGRIAVVKERRQSGLGSLLIGEIIRKADELGATLLVLGAQTRARRFYEKCGFSAFGEEYSEEGCPHINMKMNLYKSRKTPVKGVLFDLDGTTLDTLADITESYNRAMAEFGFKSDRAAEEIKGFLGSGAKALVDAGLPADCGEKQAAAVLARYKIIYEENMMIKTTPYPGISELLNKLAKRGIKVGVITNKPHPASVKLVERYFPDVPFSPVWGQRDNVPKKPDPAVPEAAAELMGLNCAEIMFVGDSDIDIKTAENAGMLSAGVLWGFRSSDVLIRCGACHIAQTADELYKIITA